MSWFYFIRIVFKKLVSADCCGILTIHQGEMYATQDVTLTNRLSLLLQGVYDCSSCLSNSIVLVILVKIVAARTAWEGCAGVDRQRHTEDRAVAAQ